MFEFDNNLVRGYSPELSGGQPSSAYMATFSDNAKTLRYIAAGHEVASQGNPTITVINATFAQRKPKFVVLERPAYVNSEAITFPPPSSNDEAEHVAYSAQQNNIPFLGAEPNDADVFKAMQQHGYTEYDVMGLYLMRVVPSGDRVGGTLLPNGMRAGGELVPFRDEEHLEQFANRYFSGHNCFSSIPEERRMDYQQFKAWFEEKNDGAIDRPIWQLSSVDAMPINAPEANFFQQMNHYVGLAREAHINHTIERALAEHDDVLVVYGAGHLVQSLPVYEQALGKAEYSLAHARTMTTEKTAEFLEGNSSLVFCEQNEFARFGAGTDRQWGGTGGMDSCSAVFLWNKDTQESYVFHTHVGTNWPETKKLFANLCAEGNWEITPASGKAYGAWQKVEEIASEIEQESQGRIRRQPTMHKNPDKEAYKAMPHESQREVPHSSYVMNSATGKVIAMDEATLEQYWEKPEYSHIFGENSVSELANTYQYITRTGTVPVCSFDGKNFTNAPPQPDGTPEMAAALQKLEDIFVEAIRTGAGEKLLPILALPSAKERMEAVKHNCRRQVIEATRNAVIEAVTDTHSDILDPTRAAQAGELGRNIYAQGIWYGMFHGNLEGYVEKAIERNLAENKEAAICPKIRDALEKFHADTQRLLILPQKPANTRSTVITR